jgi:hypothetical protein
VVLDTQSNFGPTNQIHVANGHQAVVYERNDPGDHGLWYIRVGIDPNWLPPVQLDSHPVVEIGGSLDWRVIDGFPSVAYFKSTDLYTVRALDANGDTWGAPVLAAPPIYGNQCKLNQAPDGTVVLGWNDAGTIKVLDHYSFATGAGNGPQVLATDVEDWGYAAIGPVLSGFFASTFDAGGGFEVRNTSDGVTWSPPVTITGGGSNTKALSVASIGGKPAITWLNDTDGSINYLQALDSLGTNWPAAPQVVDSIIPPLQTGSNISLIELIDGTPMMIGPDANQLNTRVWWIM